MQLEHFFVIVNYNGKNNITSAIQSILHTKGITQQQIIIVDNASIDNSLNTCISLFPSITYIKNEKNVGFATGANIGAHKAIDAGAQTVTFINPDVILDKNCMISIFDTMKKTDAAIISPIIYSDPRYTKIWFCGGKINFLRMRATHQKHRDLSRPLQKNSFISGCVMTISCYAFEKIGYFDESFFLYYEDADLSFRAQKKGLSLFIAKDARAYHKEISENHKEIKTYFLVLSGLLFFSKHTTFLQKIYLHIHLFFREIKNKFDRNNNKPLSQEVFRAFNEFKRQQ